MSESSPRTFGSDFKRFFLRGLVVLLPSVLTLWIVVKAYQFVDNTIAQPINGGMRIAMARVTPHWTPLRRTFEPSDDQVRAEMTSRRTQNRAVKAEQVRAEIRAQRIREWWDARWYMQMIGLVVAIVSVYIAGRLLGGFFGRRIYRRIEVLITSVPVIKQVYPYVKQIVDFLFSDEQPMKFNRVVVVEYPRKGIWSVGFLTGETMKSIVARSGDAVTVFIPSSPTPFTGYTITIPRSEAIELPITVEEAMRFAVSGGVLVPDHQGTGAGIPGEPGVRPDLIPITTDEPAAPDGPASSTTAAPARRDAG